tara:strand:+ start:1812 stop:3323 length:1512 start_codon:yes stop_codon:yes gene_type:complete
MQNSFFKIPYDKQSLSNRLLELNKAKIGFYSVGLYPLSLAYNCVMQTDLDHLLLAPRTGRELFGAFSNNLLDEMESKYLNKIEKMSIHYEDDQRVTNSLEYLILTCDLIVLSSNSNHIEEDLEEAIKIRSKLQREQVVISCLVGSFCHDKISNESYLLCQKEDDLAFFSGFHRHGALLNPFDSFTANFCHPDALTSIVGAKMMNSLSPNIQVSPGVHNLEGQYIKAAKNISSIFAGFCHSFHRNNPGLLPTLLTLLLDQCLDQAAKVSMVRDDLKTINNDQIFPITQLGYSVEKIDASLVKDGSLIQIRDHTFSQLTAMVADVRGSMMLPISGKPTRNFQAGQVLAENMFKLKRCPNDLDEFISWCIKADLKIGALEGIKSLKYWPQIRKSYSIEYHNSSMINLLYMSIFGSRDIKELVFIVMSQSRELSSYCKESVLAAPSRKLAKAIEKLDEQVSINFIVDSVLLDSNDKYSYEGELTVDNPIGVIESPHLKVINIIESKL